MLKIDLSAIDSWTWHGKAALLGCVCCITITLSYLSLIASPLRQWQQQQNGYTEERQRLITQRLRFQRSIEQLKQHPISPELKTSQNGLPPLKALKRCGLSEFDWQHLSPSAAGPGRPLYSLTLGLQYEQAICLLNSLEKDNGPGYLQKMVLSYQDDQTAISMQLQMVSRENDK